MPILAPAPPTQPGDAIDAHVHLFTKPLMMEIVDRPETPTRFKQAAKEGKWGRRRRDDAAGPLGRGRGELVRRAHQRRERRQGARRLGAAGLRVHAGLHPRPPTGTSTRCATSTRAIRARPSCSSGRWQPGFRGVKLYPVNRCYRLSDPACRPFFEAANELKANMIIHYGVTVDPTGDLRYADPLDLSPVARDFPGLTFTIAHFGAGWLD